MELKNQITLPDNPPFFHKEGNKKLVVFIHGLAGHPKDTWTWAESKPPFLWPEQLFNDPEFTGYDVLSFGYKSDCGTNYNIKQIAQSLYLSIDELVRAKTYKSISLVGYSLGGLVTRQFLLDHHKDFNIDSIVLLATPNDGRNLVRLVDFFCINALMVELTKGKAIDHLNDDWLNVFKYGNVVELFDYAAGYELNTVKKYMFKMKIVDKNSATYLTDQAHGWIKDHSSIAQPYGRNDELYIWVRHRLLKKPAVRQAVQFTKEEEKRVPETLAKIREVAKGTELEKAMELIGVGNLNGALVLLSKQEKEEDEKQAKTHFIAGSIYGLKRNYAKAQAHCAQASKLQPKKADYLLQAGHIHHVVKGYDKAIEYYEKALVIALKTFGLNSSKVTIYWDTLAEVFKDKGMYDKSIEYYEKTLISNLKKFKSDHPNVARAWNNLGAAWQSNGKYKLAIEYYEKALAIVEKRRLEDRVVIIRENLATAKAKSRMIR